MKRCLMVIDYQYDFVSEDGLLSAGKAAKKIEWFIDKKVETCICDDFDIIFTLDTHYRDSWDMHPESKNFNLHCEKGTKGWELYGKLNKYMECNNDRIFLVEKDSYCLDFDYIKRLVNEYDEITVLGVTTDICVLNICIVLYNAKVIEKSNVKFKICEAGCASFGENRHNYALAYAASVCEFERI